MSTEPTGEMRAEAESLVKIWYRGIDVPSIGSDGLNNLTNAIASALARQGKAKPGHIIDADGRALRMVACPECRGKTRCDCDICAGRGRIEHPADTRARYERQMDKLPKTADGVHVGIGATVWIPPEPGTDDAPEMLVVDGIFESGPSGKIDGGSMLGGCEWHECYSTREAALTQRSNKS